MTKDPITIKGTKNGLLIIIDPFCEYDNIKLKLTEKLDSAKGFFKGAKFILDQSKKSLTITEQQRSELEDICQNFGLIPSLNLENIYDLPVEKIISSAKLAKHSKAEPVNPPGEPTLFVQKNLRSGQKISYPGHVVILGNVNRGAEVIAEGNIVILGSCLGNIHAGYPRNRNVKVIATFLSPSHLSIAEHSFKILSDRIPANPEIAFIKNGEIIILNFLSSHMQAQ
ncbi:septum site-determining protein MinC [Desulfofarcimen acetoxidans DSM 771]|uniref:Probable septum site-determining protein MinC n=1 Tax=Desulfofarcimen acetoxidans (strain ATCC 49208 / DSM 771 / KCTC 5769 / VKM B-1644 / 5575) TaxID=485916 RepID=C8VWX6_DESAS|nr:septum site-determining protein MinC [Desulfofarcimen acetoxidans]ACV62552.1 septum site-determining protein MinC [Desulfofarcimen acetoxidans DSM 771]